MSTPSIIKIFNRRLGESLGMVCGGTLPRFAWHYAPAENFFVYDRDNRTLLRKSWADAPAPWPGTLGRVWLIAQWRASNAYDNMGFEPRCEKCKGEGRIDPYGVGVHSTCDGCGGSGRVASVRMPAVKGSGYSPHFETVLYGGQIPTERLNANYIWAISKQMSASIEHSPYSMQDYMMEERYEKEHNEAKDASAWREKAAAGYDDWTGAMGNLEPGKRDGYLSMPSRTSDIAPGCGFENL